MRFNKREKISIAINIVLFLVVIFLIYKGGYIHKLISKKEPYFNTQYEQRVTTFDAYETKQADIVFIGDSLTQRCDFRELLGNENIVTRGIDADTTRGVLERLDGIINLKPKKVFLLIGVNDISLGFTENESVKNYKEIISRLKNELEEVQIYTISLLPVSRNFRDYKENEFNKQINKYNENLKDIAIDTECIYIDANSKMLDGEYLKDSFTVDGIHLKGDGYKVLKEELIPYI